MNELTPPTPRPRDPASPAGQAAALEEKLRGYDLANAAATAMYDETYRTQMLDLGLPREAAGLRMVVGWARIVVDVLAERMDPLAWTSGEHVDPETLHDLWTDSGAGPAIAQAVVDHLIYGIGFLSATAGMPGDPRVLVRAHSATTTTADTDPRTGRVVRALTIHTPTRATLWRDDAIVELTRTSEHGAWDVAEARAHGLGAVPMVAVPNAPRAGHPGGRSEITPAIRSAIHSATRALAAMDVNREFFAIPHRYILGVAGDFKNADGTPLDAWKLAARAMLKIPYDDAGNDIQVGEFSQVKAGPFLEQMEGLARYVAAEAAVPAMYLGIEHANPSSADAFRAAESRLVRRSRARVASITPALNRLAAFAYAIDQGISVDDAPRISTVFARPETPAFSADADAWHKLTSASPQLARSATMWRRLGFSEDEIADIIAAHDRSGLIDAARLVSESLDAPDVYDPSLDVVSGGDEP